jgi:hypothetical protein
MKAILPTHPLLSPAERLLQIVNAAQDRIRHKAPAFKKISLALRLAVSMAVASNRRL